MRLQQVVYSIIMGQDLSTFTDKQTDIQYKVHLPNTPLNGKIV